MWGCLQKLRSVPHPSCVSVRGAGSAHPGRGAHQCSSGLAGPSATAVAPALVPAAQCPVPCNYNSTFTALVVKKCAMYYVYKARQWWAMIPQQFSLFFSSTAPQIHLAKPHGVAVSWTGECFHIYSSGRLCTGLESSLFLNCFDFCCSLNDLPPEWHNDKKTDVFPIFRGFNILSLVYFSLSSSLCFLIECIWTDLRFLYLSYPGLFPRCPETSQPNAVFHISFFSLLWFSRF